MRETVSSHRKCLHTPASRVWRSTTRVFRPHLNVPLLTKMLAVVIPDITVSGSGKRKAVDPSPNMHRSKRTRTSRGSHDEENDSGDDLSDGWETQPAILDGYPPVRVAENRTSESTLHPILRHVAEIQYLKDSSERNSEDIQILKTWSDEDKSLLEILHGLRDSTTNERAIDLGELHIGDYDGRIVALPSRAKYHMSEHEWLFLLPSLTVDGPSNDYADSISNDFFSACRILQDAGKVSITANLKILVQSNSDDVLPFDLQVEFILSLALPRALEYVLPKKSTKKVVTIHEDAQRRLFRIAFGEDDVDSTAIKEPITVSSFYSVMSPAPSLPSKKALASMQPDELLPSLLPFQCRSVGWLLGKEGTSVSSDGTISTQDSPSLFSFWKEVQLGNQNLYFNRLSGYLTDERPELSAIHGGILAEEPGLGKTLETIALIMLNPAPPDWNPSFECWDDLASLEVKAVKSTLIVTPPSLVFQWRDELANNAPSLKVLIYDGWNKVAVPIVQSDRERDRIAAMKQKKDKTKTQSKGKGKGKGKGKEVAKGKDGDSTSSPDSQLEWPGYVHQYDVVITTYSVLRSEIWVARPSLDRSRRATTLPAVGRGGYARSPLVMVKWKRVVMDEVQMVGGGQAAEMVSYVPRLSSLAVSGTPAKTHMGDLIHVLKFLRIDQIVGSLKMWNRLLKSGFSDELYAFIQHYGIRTAKASLTSELTIPKQTRYLVGIELGKVERHVYDQALQAILFDLGLDARGVAASNDWKVDGNVLRSSIRRLRGICTHPQVGQLQRKGDGLYKPGTLKTMEAVLQSMRDQNWRNMMEDWKAKIQVVVKTAQLVQHDEANKNRHQRARDLLLEAEADILKHMNEMEALLADHDLQGKALKGQAVPLNDKPVDVPGKGKARAVEDEDIEDDGGDSEGEEEGLPKTPAGDEHRTKRRAIKQRYREAIVLLHKVKFLRGDVYHVLGNNAEEDAAYQAAEELRRQLLNVSEEGTKQAIQILNTNAKRKKITEAELTIDLPVMGKGGIRSAELMEEVNEISEEVFNAQGAVLWEWRTHLMDLLTKPLNSHNGDAADGQEYQRTLDEQGEADTYLHAYSALLADRRQALVNERTLLAEHDIRETKLRQTKAARRAANREFGDDDDDQDYEDHEGFPRLDDEAELQPEHQVLNKELSTQRKEILHCLNGRAVKSILVDLTGVNMKITQENNPEKIIVKEAIKSLRHFIAEQSALFERLEGDLALIRKAFNHRVLYFRQLQEISDSVVDVEWETSVADEIASCQAEKAELDAKINTTRARHRYLMNLALNKDDESDDDEEDDQSCILCRCDFTRGFITQCAHVFCESCMKLWLSKDKAKSCPVCRVAVDLDGVQRFSLDVAEPEKEKRKVIAVTNETVPKSRRELVYNRISASLLEDIQGIETHGDFGSKIQTLVRHLSYLKVVDPGAKSIIFSAWADSLHIVEVALRQNDIDCLRIKQSSKIESAIQKFRKDPDILVLLLDGERDNAGLNITCASRVFLLESVVHHSFEVQAIARIDRLGQTRPTEVYCYYAEDTVERHILDLAARKGLSLYTKDNSVGTVSVSPFADEREQVIDSPEKRKAQHKGDFIHKVDDMLAILFPHMFEDVEYLIPASADNVSALLSSSADVEMLDATLKDDQSVRGGSTMINAEAGPSDSRRHH